MLQFKMLKQLVLVSSGGYLHEIGWTQSFKHRMPIDRNKNPLPWVTYSFIDFIDDRLTDDLDMFEYGSGNSTLWYASRVKSVTSVEHNKSWFEKIEQDTPNNVKIYYEELVSNGTYSKFSNALDKKFDIIIVDGGDRVNCIKSAINALREGGIIVLDDSERRSYSEGFVFLREEGYKKIDFWGISPGYFYKKNTTVFYKTNNCIGI